MVKEWVANLNSTEILILFFLTAILFYALKKVEEKKKEQ
ncbi:Uncharacterised protein [Campylobacter upsaliensis]|uniref:Uncharacterized protein n=1 Tax=Campylobacter upsaliensis TaxID=28080 RepID=A0A381EGW7_CAMUP|nr:Uncharacterised protein [Campylobacter upsaliensis]